jgi:hypothetical protein
MGDHGRRRRPVTGFAKRSYGLAQGRSGRDDVIDDDDLPARQAGRRPQREGAVEVTDALASAEP